MSTPTPAAPTQVRHSARAVVRTVLQVGIPTVLALGVVVPQIVDIVLKQLGDVAPAGLRGALLAVAAVVTGVAAVITRIMALPAVEAFLRSKRFTRWLAAEPEPVPPTDVDADVTPLPAGDYIPVPYGGDSKTDATYHGGGE